MKKKMDQATEAKKVNNALSADEVKKLGECEQAIRENTKMFFLAGDALIQINEERLYKAEFKSFDKYCEGRWGFSGSHARRLMEASELVKKLRSGIPGLGDQELPQNEFQARLFMDLRSEKKHWARSWKKFLEVVRKSKLPITAALIRKVIGAKDAEKSAPKAKISRVKESGDGVKTALGLIGDAKTKVSKYSEDEWTEFLDKLEKLLQAA